MKGALIEVVKRGSGAGFAPPIDNPFPLRLQYRTMRYLQTEGLYCFRTLSVAGKQSALEDEYGQEEQGEQRAIR